MIRIFGIPALIALLNILLIFIIFIFSCSLGEITTIAQNPNFNPKWDVEIRALIVDYSSTPINFETDVLENALGSKGGFALIGNEWPTDFNFLIPPGTVTIPVGDIDIDDDLTPDFLIDGYYKKDPNVLRLQIWLTDSSNNILPISSNYINIQSITIEGFTISFGSPSSYNKKLIYTSTNFFDPANEYYLDLGGNNLDFSVDIMLQSLGSPPIYSGDNYTINCALSFNLGNDFGIVGRIDTNAVLRSVVNQSIPLNDLPMESIKDFKLEFEYESNLAFDLNIANTFYGSKQVPNPDSFSTTIASGVLSTSAMHGYEYVSALKKSVDFFQFNGNILDYGDMSMDLDIRLPGASATQILLETDTLIRVKLIASGEATISL